MHVFFLRIYLWYKNVLFAITSNQFTCCFANLAILSRSNVLHKRYCYFSIISFIISQALVCSLRRGRTEPSSRGRAPPLEADPPFQRQTPSSRGRHPSPESDHPSPEVDHFPSLEADPPPETDPLSGSRPLGTDIQWRSVRILLECILVFESRFSTHDFERN